MSFGSLKANDRSRTCVQHEKSRSRKHLPVDSQPTQHTKTSHRYATTMDNIQLLPRTTSGVNAVSLLGSTVAASCAIRWGWLFSILFFFGLRSTLDISVWGPLFGFVAVGWVFLAVGIAGEQAFTSGRRRKCSWRVGWKSVVWPSVYTV